MRASTSAAGSISGRTRSASMICLCSSRMAPLCEPCAPVPPEERRWVESGDGSGEELVDLRGVELVDHAAAELHGRRQLVTGPPVLPQHGELLDLLDSGEGGVGPVDLVSDALLELRIVRRLGGRDDQRHDVRATIADDGDMRD